MDEYYYSSKDILDKAIGTDAYFQIKSILTSTKAADVEPVRHGRWLYQILIVGHIHAECSECHKVRIIDNYCPNCGAKMDEEASE